MKFMHRSAMAALAFGSLTVAGSAWASAGSNGASTAAGTPLEWQDGKAQSVDLSKGVVVYGNNAQAETNWGTVIVKDGDPASLKDIKPGDEIRAAFVSGDPFHATRIEVTSATEPSGKNIEPDNGKRPPVYPGLYYGEGSH